MSYLAEYPSEVRDFLMVCKRLADRMYVTSQGGNLSCKLEDNLILISPTCVCKSEIAEMDVVFIDMEGKTVEGTRKPTGEVPMYLNFYRDRPDVKSVIHCHPPYANTFAPFVKKYNAFLMENRGLTILSPAGICRSVQLVEILEVSAISILQALAVGEVKELSREDVRNLENTMRSRNLPMIGAPGVNKSLVDLYFSEQN